MSLKGVWSKLTRAESNIYDVPVEEHLQKTGQSHLPQAQLLTSCLKHLEKENLVEAYLRGSFSSGEADEHSDIDLFLVVDPDNLESTYNSFVKHLQKEYPILVSCHDKLVKDYGGIGFMFICKDKSGKLFQFDLYMAMKGVPPKNPLFNCPRIYTSDPLYCWIEENRNKPLPENAQRFIEHHTGGDDKASRIKYYLTDLMVTLNILQKHLTRGQLARSLNDNNHAIGVCVEMLRVISDERSHHTALYAADKLLKDCCASPDTAVRDAATAIKAQIVTPIDDKKAHSIFSLVKTLIREHEPELYKEMQASIEEYECLVLKKNKTCSKHCPKPGSP